MQRIEVGPHPWRSNSYGRFQRIAEMLEERRGVLTGNDVPRILGDCLDPFEQRKLLVGNTVAAPHNIQSLVVSPDDDALWLAHGELPVCHADRFRGFRVSALLDGDIDRCEIDDLPGAGQFNETERAAMNEYEEAWSMHMDHLDSGRAVFHLRRAAELLPEEAVFPRMAGVLLLKDKEYAQALPLLLQNAAHDYRDLLLRAEAQVWAGRCLDLMGRRAESVSYYTVAAAFDAPPVSTAAARHLEKPFTTRQLFDVTPEFMVGNALAKY